MPASVCDKFGVWFIWNVYEIQILNVNSTFIIVDDKFRYWIRISSNWIQFERDNKIKLI